MGEPGEQDEGQGGTVWHETTLTSHQSDFFTPCYFKLSRNSEKKFGLK